MRRCIALIACGLALALAACGSTAPRAWISHPRTFTACGSPDCGPSAVTLNWGTITLAGRTGYFVYLNGIQVADVNPSRYTFYGLDCGTTFTLGVRAHDGSGNLSGLISASYTSPACTGVLAPANVTVPIITGTPTQGQTLSASTGTWTGSPSSFAYQWQRCALTCSNISAATSTTYVLALADVGDTIQVTVTASNVAGATAATSARTAAIAGSGGAASIYIAQGALGSATGASCANALAVGALSSATYWVGNETIHLCGTITSAITAQGSGSAGTPVTVLWEPGAKISMAQCPSGGCVSTNGQQYVTLDGGSGGIIESTGSGTGLGGLTSVEGINLSSCNFCVVQNLTIQNMYVHTQNSTDDAAGDQDGIYVGSGHDLTIQNNAIHDARNGIFYALDSSSNNIRVTGNDLYALGSAMRPTSTANGATIGTLFIYANHFHDWQKWDANNAGGYIHEDGIQVFTSTTPQGVHWNGVYIYNNRFDGNSGCCNTAMVFVQGINDVTRAASDITSPFYVFNNVMATTAGPDNTDGNIGMASGEPIVYNNTFKDPSNGGGILASTGDVSPDAAGNAQFKNNVLDTAQYMWNLWGTGSVFASGSPDYNLYANGGVGGTGAAFVCGSQTNFFTISQFATWKSTCLASAATKDPNSCALNGISANLNSDGSIAAPSGSATCNGSPVGQPVVGAGTNLFSVCNGQPDPGLGALCKNISGVARSSTNPWNIGAY